ncbi:endolytic transglycosylase MltG [Serpentinicella sp. ANB-PHB4]|uniref:endolytic transglycosylase MltG n=1 Tax=Serpentinicella sp. ANB-PHB4 TaxID=3074076 RepID=UPI002866A50A|nr:endolytic transglycosylase MltG [Serpentinicella sp. ANB-PHB4]MDR5659229.1 endolytic transglycosylase MltG [Serpentinicella sp. ANB-PHB4]
MHHLTQAQKNLLLISLIIIGLAFMAMIFMPSYLSSTANTNYVEFTIESGSSLDSVAEGLYEKDIIKSRLWFKYKAKSDNIDKKIRPGTYQIEPDMSFDALFNMFQRGSNSYVVFTAPEGITLYQIGARIENLDLGTQEEFISATERYFNKNSFDFNTDDLFFNLEGYLYPDTYHFSEYQSIDDIVFQMAKTMEDVFTQAYLDRAEELGLSIHEVLTIASLVEKETFYDAEREKISGVIYNRLEQGMRLQIDASVIYGYGEGIKHINRVLYAHLDQDTPFNTYRRDGIPPGPIGSPSEESIRAALYPEDHDYLFYVLGEGGHVFSKTFAEHQENVRAYRNMVNNN